jgi:hypothetical protein
MPEIWIILDRGFLEPFKNRTSFIGNSLMINCTRKKPVENGTHQNGSFILRVPFEVLQKLADYAL